MRRSGTLALTGAVSCKKLTELRPPCLPPPSLPHMLPSLLRPSLPRYSFKSLTLSSRFASDLCPMSGFRGQLESIPQKPPFAPPPFRSPA
eukprot:2391928-Rhodomonas_salina.2